jgi:hypothetical protein
MADVTQLSLTDQFLPDGFRPLIRRDDGGGGKAIQSIESVAQSFKLKKAADPVLVKGRPDAEAAGARTALGAKLAASAG